MTRCREQGVDFLIQAKDTGAPGDLMARLNEGEADGENRVRFSDFTGRDRVNTFAYPIHTGEIGSDEREDHTTRITEVRLPVPGPMADRDRHPTVEA